MQAVSDYNKSLFAGPEEVLSINLTIKLKNLIILLIFSNMIYLYFLYITVRAKYY